ncbi:BFD-like [2Fe-2S] binding domain protein [compost metagenome]
MNVNADSITRTLGECTGSASERLAQLQTRLGCGTQCGSCIPELKRHVQATAGTPSSTHA